MPFSHPLVFLLLGGLAGFLAAALIFRRRINLVVEAARSEERAARMLIDQQLSYREEELSRQIQEKEDLQQRLDDREQVLIRYDREKVRLDEQEKQLRQRIRDFEDQEKRMAKEFENLAGRILEEKGERFARQNRESLDEILKPVQEQLGEFRKRLDHIHSEDTRDRSSLREQLKNLSELNQQMNREACNLTRALKGDNRVQGVWGEMILEKVLEQSGLRKGKEYEVQGGFYDSENRLLKPDVIIHLPEDKDVVVDSKVSLVAYNKYTSLQDSRERQAALREHVQAVRSHIKGLGSKDYSGLKGLRSLDFVLMFMPIDAAFMAAFQEEERLFNEAFEKKIVIVTPTTLLATLRTIENIWRYERQNENSRNIAERAGRLYDKFCLFLEDIEKIGKQLNTVHSTYDSALNRLSRGRGNLIQQAETFRELGVRVKKELPDEFRNYKDSGS
ncbi:MAG: DNA recombination protein RmuC [Thermodesulfobacteriota bacterium]